MQHNGLDEIGMHFLFVKKYCTLTLNTHHAEVVVNIESIMTAGSVIGFELCEGALECSAKPDLVPKPTPRAQIKGTKKRTINVRECSETANSVIILMLTCKIYR